jgi:Ca2+-binding RTX toxin-like protein
MPPLSEVEARRESLLWASLDSGQEKKKERMRPLRRVAMLAIVGSVLLVAFAGVAWAANITCPGGPCVGTEENDRITGSLLDDQIQALGGRDHVQARQGDDQVEGDAGHDEITGGVGADLLFGDMGPDEIGGGPGTPEGDPITTFTCSLGEASTSANQAVNGGDGNDSLTAGRDNDYLVGGAGRNTLSGNGGGDCFALAGEANEQASGGDGNDIFSARDGNADDIFCGAGDDTVQADEEDRVAADCENEIPQTSLQAGGSTPEAEVTITTP